MLEEPGRAPSAINRYDSEPLCIPFAVSSAAHLSETKTHDADSCSCWPVTYPSQHRSAPIPTGRSHSVLVGRFIIDLAESDTLIAHVTQPSYVYTTAARPGHVGQASCRQSRSTTRGSNDRTTAPNPRTRIDITGLPTARRGLRRCCAARGGGMPPPMPTNVLKPAKS
jgi:hypothetical protein